MESENKKNSSEDCNQIQREDATGNDAVNMAEEQSNRICVFVKIEGTHTSSTETDQMDHNDMRLAKASTSQSISYVPSDKNTSLLEYSEKPDQKDILNKSKDFKQEHNETVLENCDTVRNQTVTDILGKMNENILTIIEKFGHFNSDFYNGQTSNDRRQAHNTINSLKTPKNNTEQLTDIHVGLGQLSEEKTKTDSFRRPLISQMNQPCTSASSKMKSGFDKGKDSQSVVQEKIIPNNNSSKQQQDIPEFITDSSHLESYSRRTSSIESAFEVLKNEDSDNLGLGYVKASTGDSEAIFVPLPVFTDTDMALTNLAPCERTYHMLHIEAASSPTSSVMYRPPLCVRLWSVLTDFFTAVCLCLQVNRDCIFCLGFFVAFVVSASFLTAFFYRTLNVDPQVYQQNQQNQRDAIAVDKVDTVRYKRSYYY